MGCQLDPSHVAARPLPPSTTSYHIDVLNQSLPATTPNLSFSPSSTESSGGDSTIQMTSFLDEPVAPFGVPGISGSKYGRGWTALTVNGHVCRHGRGWTLTFSEGK